MAVLEVEGGLRSRHREVARMLGELERAVRKFGEGGSGGGRVEQKELQTGCDAESSTGSSARSGAATELVAAQDVFVFGAQKGTQKEQFAKTQTLGADRQGGAQQPFAAPPMQFYWG